MLQAGGAAGRVCCWWYKEQVALLGALVVDATRGERCYREGWPPLLHGGAVLLSAVASSAATGATWTWWCYREGWPPVLQGAGGAAMVTGNRCCRELVALLL
jgi:hypothetical protein